MFKISELYIYPIKSLAGIPVGRAKITDKGFENDRRYLLVDEHNRFLTQREHAQMALLQPSIGNDTLTVTHKQNGRSITLPLKPESCSMREMVRIWDETCIAEPVSEEANVWFTEMLGIPAKLVYMPDDCQRIVDQRYAFEDTVTSFSDAYPFLIIGQASLDELNGRLGEKIPMNRFRPNIVFEGGNPFDEDLFGEFKIGGITFWGVKLCARCIMTTIDQETAKGNKEPLKTLARYRFKNNKIMFGQNLIHKGTGEIATGDELNLIKQNSDDRFLVH